MQLDELKQKYKELPMWARLLLMGILGLLPGILFYFEEGQGYEDKLSEVRNQESTARTAFEKARQRKSDLPKLEERLAFTEDQLRKAQKLLPDRYIIEEILENTASIALKTNVLLEKFKPLEEKAHEKDGYRYVELPIDTQITGDYPNIATFFDKIAHLERTIFIRDIKITPGPNRPAIRGGDFPLSSAQQIPGSGPLGASLSQTSLPNGSPAGDLLPPGAANRNGVINQSVSDPSSDQGAAEPKEIPQETAQFNLVIYRSFGENETGLASTDFSGGMNGINGATPPKGGAPVRAAPPPSQ